MEYRSKYTDEQPRAKLEEGNSKSKLYLVAPFSLGIPYIWQFWYTTTLFRPLKVHQKVHKFATKYAKISQTDHNRRRFRALYAEKYIDLKQKYKMVVVTNMSFASVCGRFGAARVTVAGSESLREGQIFPSLLPVVLH